MISPLIHETSVSDITESTRRYLILSVLAGLGVRLFISDVVALSGFGKVRILTSFFLLLLLII